MNYQPVIGLEVHVELATKSKMFCRCSAEYFGKEPNTHVCPVCLGLPGALPYPNKTAIEWCIMIGQALNCKIPLLSKFDRKNYFYPDLSKGYQISQYDEPLALNGSIQTEKGKTIRIRRVHMEEDTGKLIHANVSGKNVSLIDFNRSGVPLVEIVTEPDFESAQEVVSYLKKLQQIVRYLGVSNADMEKGDMRLEPNISLRETSNTQLPKYKVEVKNINSFRFVERAVNFEIDRQTKILDIGETPAQETRGWDENKQKTLSQRSKEEAHDYRYFPEPDIPPLHFTQDQISSIKDQIQELPDQKIERFQKEHGLSFYDSEILTREKETADYFERAVRHSKSFESKNSPTPNPKMIANWIINKKIDRSKLTVYQLIHAIQSSMVLTKIPELELEEAVKKVLSENPKAVEDYKKGKESVIMFLVGQVMKAAEQKLDAKIVKGKIEEIIKK